MKDKHQRQREINLMQKFSGDVIGKLLGLGIIILMSAGCVMHIPLAEQVPSVGYASSSPIALSIVDERNRVKKGKSKTFIGVAHGAFGIPSDLHIKPVVSVEEGDTERELAAFLSYRLARGLEQNGWKVTELSLSSVPSEEEALRWLTEKGDESLLLLKLKEWYFSINLNWVTAFNFDSNMDVTIYRAGKGKVLDKNIAARDVIDAQASQSYQNHILMAYRDRLAKILTDPEVRKALETNDDD